MRFLDLNKPVKSSRERSVHHSDKRSVGQYFVPDCNHFTSRHTCNFFRFTKNSLERKHWIRQIRLVNSDIFCARVYTFTSNFFLDNSSALEEVNEFRDLGLTIDQHLRWNSHIDKVVAKANTMLEILLIARPLELSTVLLFDPI